MTARPVTARSGTAARPGAVPRGGVASTLATCAGVVGPYVLALLLWALGSPRPELVAAGGGRGVALAGTDSAAGAQLLGGAILLAAAAVASTLVLWRRCPGLWRPAGVVACTALTGLACALAAGVATPLGRLLRPADVNVPAGELVRLPPSLGPLYTGDVVPLTTGGPQWSSLPAVAGWFVLGAFCATATVAVVTYVGDAREVFARRAADREGEGYPAGRGGEALTGGPGDARPRTGR